MLCRVLRMMSQMVKGQGEAEERKQASQKLQARRDCVLALSQKLPLHLSPHLFP